MNQQTEIKFSVRLIEPGIVENIVLKGSTLEGEDAAVLKKMNLEAAGNKPYCVLVMMEEMTIITKEWKAITSSSEYVQKTIAKAVLVKNMAQGIITSFYLKFNKPVMQTRAFKNREEALEWLRHCYREHLLKQGAKTTVE